MRGGDKAPSRSTLDEAGGGLAAASYEGRFGSGPPDRVPLDTCSKCKHFAQNNTLPINRPIALIGFFNTKRSISVIHKEQSYLTRDQLISGFSILLAVVYHFHAFA
jgi:hypothetical protein